MSCLQGRAISARLSLASGRKSLRVRSALSHMQVQTMRRQRSKHFPNARVGSRTRRRTKNIGKNETTALARLVRAIGWVIGGATRQVHSLSM
jgi:hypothetical protein